MSQALRTLLAVFDVDTGSAETALKSIDKKVEGSKETLASLAKTVAAAFSIHEISSFLESMIDLGSQLNDMSEKLGVGTDDLQKFQYAAQLSGVGAEEAGHALQLLNKNMGEALAGNKDAVQQFTALGVSLKDSEGNVRELGDVIPEVADAFEKMGSDQERTTQAMKLFGKSGASLIPLLKGGSEELLKMNKQFEDLGLGIDEDFIHKADEAGDALDTMKLGFRALKTTVAAEVLPYVKTFAEYISRAIATVRRFTKDTLIVKEAWIGMGIAAAAAAMKIFYGWGKVTGLLKSGAGLLENLLSLGSIGLAIGLIGLVALSIEDIVVMCKGGQSVLGEFIDKFLGIGEKQKLIEELTNAWKAMTPALDELKALAPTVLEGFAKGLPYVIGFVTDLVKGIMAAVLAVKALGSLTYNSLAASKPGEQDAANDKFLKDSDAIQKLLSHSTLLDMVNAPAKAPATTGGGDMIGPVAQSTKAGVTTIGSINITGGMTNEETAAAVTTGVQNGITGAQSRANAGALTNAAPRPVTRAEESQALDMVLNGGG